MVSALIIPLGLGIWILLHDWVSAAVLVLTIPLIPLFMILIGRYTEHRVDEAAEGLNRLSQHLLELARGLPVLVIVPSSTPSATLPSRDLRPPPWPA